MVRYLSPSESEWTGRNLVAQKKKVGAEILQISGWLQNLAVSVKTRGDQSERIVAQEGVESGLFQISI